MLGSCLQVKHGISDSVSDGACLWDGSQVGPVTGWLFLQDLLHFYPCISVRQEPKILKVGWCAHTSNLPCLTSGCGLIKLYLSATGHFG